MGTSWLRVAIVPESSPLKCLRLRGAYNFVIAVIPFGDSTFSKAVDDALASRGGDALINVTVSSSLYGFVPIYNVYSFTCTSQYKGSRLNTNSTQKGRAHVLD
jgi:hypothetical protein